MYQHVQYSCKNAIEKLLYPGLHCWHTVDTFVLYVCGPIYNVCQPSSLNGVGLEALCRGH